MMNAEWRSQLDLYGLDMECATHGLFFDSRGFGEVFRELVMAPKICVIMGLLLL